MPLTAPSLPAYVLVPGGVVQGGFKLPSGVVAPVPVVIAQSAVPIILPPGDGAAAGLQLSGTLGAFNLVGAVTLQYTPPNGSWMVLGNAVGGIPAGTYYATWSSTGAGILYNNTLAAAGNNPNNIPASPVAFSGLAAGAWLTQSVAALSIKVGVLSGGLLGLNGLLRWSQDESYNLSAGTKTTGFKLGASTVWSFGTSANNQNSPMAIMRNRASQAFQFVTRSNTSIGNAPNTTSASQQNTINTAIDNDLNVLLQISANTDCVALEGYTAEVIPG